MDRARIHEGMRRMRFTDVLGRSERSELSRMEAAELLGISERTLRRRRDQSSPASRGLRALPDQVDARTGSPQPSSPGLSGGSGSAPSCRERSPGQAGG